MKNKKRRPVYADLADLEEDKRINIIGHAVMDHKKTAAFITDDTPGKANRYVKKLKERFPGIVIIDQFVGPVPKTITIKVGPPTTSPSTPTASEG